MFLGRKIVFEESKNYRADIINHFFATSYLLHLKSAKSGPEVALIRAPFPTVVSLSSKVNITESFKFVNTCELLEQLSIPAQLFDLFSGFQYHL